MKATATLLAALLLLASCATPARLPVQTSAHPVEHDARTRTAEPGASHIR